MTQSLNEQSLISNTQINVDESKINLTYAITNARSLRPKLESMYAAFENLDLDFLIVTETWLTRGPDLDELVRDAEHGHGLSVLTRCRPKTSSRNPGGGVAVIVRKRTIKASYVKCNHGGYELLTVKLKIVDNSRPVYVIAAYIPPRTRLSTVPEINRVINDIILKVKNETQNPYIILAGDINKFNINDAYADYNDMEELDTPPTRGPERLDIAVTNMRTETKLTRTRDPLCNDNGIESDHGLLVVGCSLKHVHQFTKIKYTTKEFSQENKDLFNEEFAKVDWLAVANGSNNVDDLTKKTQDIITDLDERCFPTTSRTRKSTDPPWITDSIKRAVRRRKRAYGKNYKRTADWKKLKRETDRMIADGKKKFYDAETDKLSAAGSSKIPFKILKDITEAERPAPWSVSHMRPNKTDTEIAEELADFFIEITSNYEPISRIPSTFPAPFPKLMPHEVAESIRKLKKPKSMIRGDIHPSLVNKNADLLAVTACKIFNLALTNKQWPAPWREETQTIIPKEQSPDTFDQLRNLSCTNMLSKLLETYVLERLKSEIHLSLNQFGGVKGSGSNHFLTHMWHQIMKGLSGGQNVVSLVSVDLSKAFNRMDHQVCLDGLARRGASSDTLQMVAAFLTGRSMKVKVGQVFSEARQVNGGAPQGTKMGNLLFSITIEDLEKRNSDLSAQIAPEVDLIGGEDRDQDEEDNDIFGMRRMAREMSCGPITRFNSGVIASTPAKHRTADGVLRYDDISGRTNNSLASDLHLTNLDEHNAAAADSASSSLEWVSKFVDDITGGQTVPISHAAVHLTTRKEKRKLHAIKNEELFHTIVENANSKGMKVNPKKTQLLSISASVNSNIQTYIKTDGQMIISGESMKILGFVFGQKPDAWEHLKHIRKKYSCRAWAIRHLKKAGIENTKLVAIYKSLIRPIIEYSCQVYHHLLNKTQEDYVERMQMSTMKTIYGMDTPYEMALQQSGLDRLSVRAARLAESFAQKLSENQRYSEWFPLKPDQGYPLRRPLTYNEEFAAENRLFNSPLFRMRRMLNDRL